MSNDHTCRCPKGSCRAIDTLLCKPEAKGLMYLFERGARFIAWGGRAGRLQGRLLCLRCQAQSDTVPTKPA